MGKRVSPTANTHIELVNQVNGLCPLCDKRLLYWKGGNQYKGYEIAHIYPLNPTLIELDLLKDEERLADHPNHEHNLIPLCKSCHGRFDKPRTIDEYRMLLNLKRECLKRAKQHDLWHDNKLEKEIEFLIRQLCDGGIEREGIEIEFDPKEIDRKIDSSMHGVTKRRIHDNVDYYYVRIKKIFALMDSEQPEISDIIATQIKLFYKRQLNLALTQQEIYQNIVEWVNAQVDRSSRDAADIVVSFFIQNCEVFE